VGTPYRILWRACAAGEVASKLTSLWQAVQDTLGMSIVAVAGMRSTAKKYDIDQSNSLFFLFQWMLLIQIHPHTKKGTP
jgi:hypothetical protein